jgi:hypothetical protein
MSWGHVVAIESYPQALDAWGEVMLHYGYPRMYRFTCSTVNGCELVWYQTWSVVLLSESKCFSIAISYIISVYCEDYAGYFTVILPFLAFISVLHILYIWYLASGIRALSLAEIVGIFFSR